MPVYYNTSTGNLMDDVTNTSLGDGAVIVEACDNPFNNADINDTWMDSNQTIWIATGKTSEFAKEAAEWLINRTCLLWNQSTLDDKGFWLVQYKCGDVNGNGNVVGDSSDYFKLKYYVLGKGGAISSNWAADTNGNGNIQGDSSDYFKLKYYVLGKGSLNCKRC